MAMVELVPVELIPDFDSLIEVWITLFGQSESNAIVELYQLYCETDFHYEVNRTVADWRQRRFCSRMLGA